LEPLRVDRDQVGDLPRRPLRTLLVGQEEDLPVHGDGDGGPDPEAGGVAEKEVVSQAEAHHELARGNNEGEGEAVPPVPVVVVPQEHDHPVQDLRPDEDAEVVDELEGPRADKVAAKRARQRLEEDEPGMVARRSCAAGRLRLRPVPIPRFRDGFGGAGLGERDQVQVVLIQLLLLVPAL
jgi:hypothetical protein